MVESGAGIQHKQLHRMKSISVKLTLFALALSILPVLLASSVLMLKMENIVERELMRSYSWLVSEHMSNAVEKIEEYVSYLQFTAQNTTILNALTADGENTYLRGKTISAEVYKTIAMKNRREVRDCLIYSNADDRIYGTRVTTLSGRTEESWYGNGWSGGEDCMLDVSWDGRRLLTFIEPLIKVDVAGMSNEKLGAIRLELYLDGLFAPSFEQSAEAEDYQLALFDDQGECLYTSQSSVPDILADWTPASDCSDMEMQSLNSYTLIQQPLAEYGLTLVYLFDNNEITLQKQALKRMIYPLVLALVAVIAACAMIYFKSFSQRVNKLVRKFRIAATGDLMPKPPIGGEDEIAMLDSQFDQMLCEMNELNRRNDAQRNTIREARYRNLQLQINPHFLYNTLETISAIGAVHGVFQVCDLCEKLGSVFRYSLGKNEGKYTALANEIRQTQNYIFIQQVRYKFEVYYSIDLDADEAYVLRFLLQPIVENAILHGLARRADPGTLEVHAYLDQADLMICIRDDGVGMDADTLANLRALIAADTDSREDVTKVGVWNISQRIRSEFGDSYGLEVDSWPGHGTEFRLRLPYLTGEMIVNDEVQAAARG